MADLPAMDRCPVGKEGRHALMALFLNEADPANDLTLACQHCGAMRRVPLGGAMVPESLDSLDADAILARIGTWETR